MNREQELLLAYLAKFAKNLDGGQLGVFTGLIGELSACRAMKAQWKPGIGYDGVFKGRRVSIKTRRRRKDRDKSPRMGIFKPDSKGNHNFDIGWYVEIDESFKLTGIWQAQKDVVLRMQSAAGNKRGIPTGRFRSVGAMIWPST